RLETGIHEELRRGVIEDIRRHPAEPAHLIHDPAVVREQFAQGHAALAMTIEFPRGAKKGLCPLQESKALALHEALRRLLTGELSELWLVLTELELARGRSPQHGDC